MFARQIGIAAWNAGRVALRAVPSTVRVMSPTRITCAALPTAYSAPFSGGSTRSLFIRIESTPNPDSMKFVPENKQVLPEKFGNGLATGAAFVRRLFKYKEITGVFLGRDFVSVNKSEDASWMALKPIVLDVLMDAFADAEAKNTLLVEETGAASTSDAAGDDDDEVVAMIKELLETRIRPAVQEDGGDILFKGFDPETGIVKLKMAGSCVGCPSSTATLRNGVENMLMHYIPEVRGIKQVKDELDELNDKEYEEVEKKIGATAS